ncbi:MAG TPA: AMP-binding protein [Rubrivivax sp.]|nr:AMP-binding protein [Rubrivivax sp.]
MQEPSPSDTAAQLSEVVRRTLAELQAGVPGLPAVTLASVLDRELGFDSLARVELLMRIERRFGVQLPEDTLQRAETVADLLAAVQRATGAGRSALPVPPPTPTPAPPGPGSGAADIAAAAGTLLEALDAHLRVHPDRVQVTVLGDGHETPISYRRLDEGSSALAAGLQRIGVAPRQCVAIMLPTSAEYFFAYLGILEAGAIPVPIYPPARLSQLEDHVRRHTGILANAQAVALLSVPEAMAVARLLQAGVPGLRHVTTPSELAAGGARPAPVPVRADDVAFIQYTSGSTGQPKGVALTHANLLANVRAMAAAVQATPRDVFVSWLPLYHDMGLIGAWLGSMLVGFPLVVMSPLAFLARPRRWLEAITRYGGTLSAGPNFAYELCLKRLAGDDLAGLDLRTWRLAFNGAEAVSPDTVRRFSERFAACGLAPTAMAPVYGLAEACVGLLFPPLGRVAPVDRIDRESFSRERRALPASAADATALRFVGCGRALPGHEVRIVDDAGRELGERSEGRLEFRGPSATAGYWRNPEQTARLLHDGWLDSGDRAYRAEGELYLTGRVKDIVIRGGRNLYPQEIEEAVSAVDGIRKGCVAAFGSADQDSGTERLIVLAEVPARRLHDAAGLAALRETVGRAVVDAIGEPADAIVLAPPHTVLKTSSGKVRRSACRERYERGETAPAAAGARLQMLRLAGAALGQRLRAAVRRLGRAVFGLWAVLLLWLLVPPFWLLCVLMPTPAAAWRVARIGARTLLRGAALPLVVRGLEQLPAQPPAVLVCNHASYIDGLVLVAALPRPCRFVAKHELAGQFIAGRLLRRLGALFVERADRRRSVEDAQQLAAALVQGQSLLVFPEGGFGPQPGLRPFHLGAFAAAVEAGAAVVPLVLRGTRELLPYPHGWPRPAALAVEIGSPLPLAARGGGFAAAVRLRDAARAWIARGLASAPDEVLPGNTGRDRPGSA